MSLAYDSPSLAPLLKLHDFWVDHATSRNSVFPRNSINNPVETAREMEWDCIYELRDAIEQITGKRPGGYNGSVFSDKWEPKLQTMVASNASVKEIQKWIADMYGFFDQYDKKIATKFLDSKAKLEKYLEHRIKEQIKEQVKAAA